MKFLKNISPFLFAITGFTLMACWQLFQFVLHWKDEFAGLPLWKIMDVCFYECIALTGLILPIGAMLLLICYFHRVSRKENFNFHRSVWRVTGVAALFAILSFGWMSEIVPRANFRLLMKLFDIRSNKGITASDPGYVSVNPALFRDAYQCCSFSELSVYADSTQVEMDKIRHDIISELDSISDKVTIDSVLKHRDEEWVLSIEDFKDARSVPATTAYTHGEIAGMLGNSNDEILAYDRTEQQYHNQQWRMIFTSIAVLILSLCGFFAGVLLRKIHFGFVFPGFLIFIYPALCYIDYFAIVAEKRFFNHSVFKAQLVLMLLYLLMTAGLFLAAKLNLRKRSSMENNPAV